MTSATETATRAAGPDYRHDLRRLWVGETTSALGSSVTAVALPLVALTRLHAGVLEVSLLSAAAWLPWLLIGLPAGAWVDRWPKRRLMMACDVISLVLFVSVPVAAWARLLTIGQLLVVALLAGTAKVFFATAYRAYLPGIVPPEGLAGANARLQGSESAANVAGPGVGGAMAQAVGAATSLLLDAASFAVSLACLARIRAAEPPVAARRQTLRKDIAEGIRFVVRDRLLTVLTLFGGAANLMINAFGAIEIAFLVREVGLRAGSVGLLLATISSGGVVGAMVAPALGRRFGTARALLLTKCGCAPAVLLAPFAEPGWRMTLFVAGWFVPTAGIVAGNIISAGFMQRYCPLRVFGRVTTSMQVVNFGAIPVGAVLGGVAADALGYRPALWLVSIGFVGAAAILLLAPMGGGRDLPTRPAEAS